jgi:hypothetical protein
MLGTPIKILGTSIKVLGTSIKMFETSIKILGTPIKILGTSIKMLGISIKMLGTPIKMLVTSIKMLGTSIKILGTSIKVIHFSHTACFWVSVISSSPHSVNGFSDLLERFAALISSYRRFGTGSFHLQDQAVQDQSTNAVHERLRWSGG